MDLNSSNGLPNVSSNALYLIVAHLVVRCRACGGVCMGQPSLRIPEYKEIQGDDTGIYTKIQRGRRRYKNVEGDNEVGGGKKIR